MRAGVAQVGMQVFVNMRYWNNVGLVSAVVSSDGVYVARVCACVFHDGNVHIPNSQVRGQAGGDRGRREGRGDGAAGAAALGDMHSRMRAHASPDVAAHGAMHSRMGAHACPNAAADGDMHSRVRACAYPIAQPSRGIESPPGGYKNASNERPIPSADGGTIAAAIISSDAVGDDPVTFTGARTF